MHFDDRLGTVLRLRADGPAVRRIQYRQLLDLLGTMPSDARGPQIDCAFARLSELAVTIPAAERAAMLKDHGLRLRSPRLVASLAADDRPVAAAAIEYARLSEDEWVDLVPALPLATRGLVRRRRDLGPAVGALLDRLGIRERSLPPAAGAAVAADQREAETRASLDQSEPGAKLDMATPDVVVPLNTAARTIPPQADAGEAGIGAIVRRIEAYRRARETDQHAAASDAPRLPLGEDHVLRPGVEPKAFDFATDATGRIVWSDPGVAPMVLGLALASLETPANTGIGEALRRRQPLSAVRVALRGAPAIAGPWQIDAAPWFDSLTGRHLGWRGRMRRPSPVSLVPAPGAAAKPESQADRIRQMLHELRTPVNAIQGFAEVIQQQLFGPTPHEYRALAASIAGDAARMLAAFEELERLAKLESRALELARGETDLAEVVATTVSHLADHTRQRGSGFALKPADGAVTVPFGTIEVERIVWRLLATLAGVSAPGEVLRLKIQRKHGMARIDVDLPAVLAARSEGELFQASAGAIPQVISAGVFGIGFALRLVGAEASAAGGALVHKGDRLRLSLPGLTRASAGHSHSEGGNSDISALPAA